MIWLEVSKLVEMLTNTSVVCSRKLSNRAYKLNPTCRKLIEVTKMELPSFFPYFLLQGHALLIKYVYIDENFSLIQKMFYWIAEKFQKNSFESIINRKLPSYGNQFSCKLSHKWRIKTSKLFISWYNKLTTEKRHIIHIDQFD